MSTAGAADAAAEGTPEPAQALSPQAETKDKAQAIPPTADAFTADTAPQTDEASVANASSADEDQKVTVVVAATATTDAAAATATIAATDATTNAAAASGVAASAAAAASDGATRATAASPDQVANVEEGAASQDSATAAAVVMSESDHTAVNGAPSGVQQGQPDQLSSRHAFAAAQYATGKPRYNFGLVMTPVLMGAVL